MGTLAPSARDNRARYFYRQCCSWRDLVPRRCHWAFCFVIRRLEQVIKSENDEQSSCKNGSRTYKSGCNALDSYHPYSYCILGRSRELGLELDAERPLPLRTAKRRPKARKEREFSEYAESPSMQMSGRRERRYGNQGRNGQVLVQTDIRKRMQLDGAYSRGI